MEVKNDLETPSYFTSLVMNCFLNNVKTTVMLKLTSNINAKTKLEKVTVKLFALLKAKDKVEMINSDIFPEVVSLNVTHFHKTF